MKRPDHRPSSEFDFRATATPEPMKILMIVHGFPPECSGGTEHFLLNVCRKLKARRHEVEVLCGSHDGAGGTAVEPRVETSRYKGIRVHRLHRTGLYNDDWSKSLAPEVEGPLAAILARFRPDLVHVHHWIRLSRNLIELCHDHGVPALCTLHDLWSTCPKAFRVRDDTFCQRPVGPESCLGCAPAGETLDQEEQRRELALFRDDYANELRLARRIVVPSLAHRNVLLAHHPELAGRFRVIPHGKLSPIQARTSPAKPARDGRLRIGHWGHLSRLKGIDVLLEALAGSPLKRQVKLELFGTLVYPEERAAIKALAEEIDVTWHGEFTPKDLEKTDLDLAVIPSRCSESWSFVLDEAFLLGLPAVVSGLGALSERIGGAGTTFKPGDPADLRRVLESVIKDRSLLERWRQLIPTLPDLDAQVRALEDVYHEVTSSRAELPTTPQSLRARRLHHRALQVELRNRQREADLSQLTNVQDDIARANRSMAEMEFYHGEKDKELARLASEVTRLESRLTHDIEAEARKWTGLEKRNRDLEVANDRRAQKERKRRERLARRLLLAQNEARGLRNELASIEPDSNQHTDALEDQVAAHSEALVAQSADHAAEVERLRAEAEAATTRIEALAMEADDLRRALDELTIGPATELVDALRRVDELDRRLTALDSQWDVAVDDGPDEPAIAPDKPLQLPALAGQEGEDLRAKADRLGSFLESVTEAQRRFAERIVRREKSVRRLGATLEGLMDNLTQMERRRAQAAGPTSAPLKNQRLKILLVIHQFLPRHVAGTEIYTYNLARELAKTHEVVILTAESDHSRPRYEHSRTSHDGLKIHQVIHNYTWHHFRDTFDSPESDAIFRRVLREERPDVVHIQHLHYFSVNFATIARNKGIPVVYTLHDYILLCPRDGQMRRADGERCHQPVPSKCADCIAHHPLSVAPPMMPRALRPGVDALVPDDVARAVRILRDGPTNEHEQAIVERLDYLRRVLRDVDLFISPSQFLRDTFVDSGLIPADRVIVSDNGIDLSLFPEEREVRRKRGPGLELGYVGTIAEHKGLHVLIEAMNGIDDPTISCKIWGDLRAFVEYSDYLRGLIKNPRTLLMGPFPPARVHDVISGHDALVIPSLWWENSPLTIHEAALVGIPVLASRLGGMAEYVTDYKTGRLFDPDDPNDLRAKILEMARGNHVVDDFEPTALVVKDIKDDARDMTDRYRRLLARKAAASPR